MRARALTFDVVEIRTLQGVLLQQVGDQVAGVLRNELWDVNTAVLDAQKGQVGASTAVGRLSCQELIHDAPDGPQVARARGFLIVDDLGRHILGCADKVGSVECRVREVLGRAKINEANVSVALAHDHVLGLQVAVQDVVRVHVLDGVDNVGEVEARKILVQRHLPPVKDELVQQFAPVQQLEQEVEVHLVLCIWVLQRSSRR